MWKKAKNIFYGFIKIVMKSKHKPNKLWVDQGRVLHNNLLWKYLDDNDILLYSAQNKGESIVAETL